MCWSSAVRFCVSAICYGVSEFRRFGVRIERVELFKLVRFGRREYRGFAESWVRELVVAGLGLFIL